MSYIWGSELPHGALIFQNNRKSIYSKAINLQTTVMSNFTKRGRIGHVAIVCGSISKNKLVLEADNVIVDVNFVQKYSGPEHYLEIFDIASLAKLPYEQVLDAVDEIIDTYKLQSYGKGQILGFVLEPFLRLVGVKNNPFPGGIICSELGVRYLEALKLTNTLPTEDVNMVSPEDLYCAVTAIYGKPSFIKLYGSTELLEVKP